MSEVPAHLIEEAVGFCHSVELMFVLLQKIHIALLWDKLQQLMGQKSLFTLHIYNTIICTYSSVKDSGRIYDAASFS